MKITNKSLALTYYVGDNIHLKVERELDSVLTESSRAALTIMQFDTDNKTTDAIKLDFNNIEEILEFADKITDCVNDFNNKFLKMAFDDNSN